MITDPDVERYCEELTSAPEPFLNALAAETRDSLESPQMLTGALEGRFLQMLVWTGQPQRVLELGTYSGYSALTMAAALPPGGRIWTCELSGERADFAQAHIDASPYADRIEIVRGPALESARRLEGPWDLAFVDADKDGYPDYYEAVLSKLAPRGLIAIDNTLRSGRVVGRDDEAGAAMDDFNRMVAADPRVLSTLVPIRDGVTLVRLAR